jgi:hypothetical protein
MTRARRALRGRQRPQRFDAGKAVAEFERLTGPLTASA